MSRVERFKSRSLRKNTMVSLHFIGVVHHDEKGRERLERALEIERPDVVTIEIFL